MITEGMVPKDASDGSAAIFSQLRESVVEVVSGGHGAGSGVVWRPDGVIVTNHHVAPRERAGVVLSDGRSFTGHVLARDERNDLVALKIDADGLRAITPRANLPVRPGELVMAIGHPLGVRHAVTLGIVCTVEDGSGSDRRALIRADVRLNPGNSGGLLADAHGHAVGINAMVADGLALAVPARLAEALVLTATRRQWLGIEGQTIPLPPTLAVAAAVTASSCVLVLGVAAGGAAAAAGLMTGDLLVALDGQPLQSADELLRILHAHTGGPMQCVVVRGGVPRDMIVVPGTEASRAA